MAEAWRGTNGSCGSGLGGDADAKVEIHFKIRFAQFFGWVLWEHTLQSRPTVCCPVFSICVVELARIFLIGSVFFLASEREQIVLFLFA